MLSANNLLFRYGKKNAPAIENLSFSVQKGDICILLGPNGAGKSTLLKLILGLYKPEQGELCYDEKSLTKMRQREKAQIISYLPQSASLPCLSVYETVLLGRVNQFVSRPGETDKEAAIKAMDKVGILPLAERNANELSGGECQKVALARALAQGGEVLLFDEPTSNLDIGARVQTLELARLAKKEGKTILIALHDINDALSIGDHFLLLQKGRKLAEGNEEVVNEKNLVSLYGLKCHSETINKRRIIIWEK